MGKQNYCEEKQEELMRKKWITCEGWSMWKGEDGRGREGRGKKERERKKKEKGRGKKDKERRKREEGKTEEKA